MFGNIFERLTSRWLFVNTVKAGAKYSFNRRHGFGVCLPKAITDEIQLSTDDKFKVYWNMNNTIKLELVKS